MAKQAKIQVKVSAQPVVVMEAEVARKIRQHCRTSMKAEVCGVLIGSTAQERMTVEACIAGVNAAQGGAHVTFTQDTWEHIYKIKDKEYPDDKIVGWYHSHPGFGVFLSEHDLFIQQNFFSNPQQVAWVYDPHTDEEGCFGWIGGKIEKLSAIRVGFSQSVEITGDARSDYDESDDPASDMMMQPERNSEMGNHETRTHEMWNNGSRKDQAWVRWSGRVLGYLAVVLLGLAGGFVLRDRQLGPVLDRCELVLEHPVEACRALLQPYMTTPPFVPEASSVPGQASGQQPANGKQQEKPPAKKGNNAKP